MTYDAGTADTTSADPGSADHLTKLPCQNCGDPAEGNYCRVCGQHKIDHRTSFRALVSDAVEDLSLTSELPRTLQALFFKPGFLTLEYSAGRIARYIPPLRLYLAASLVFFFTLSLVTRNATGSSGQSVTASDTARARVKRDSVRLKNDSIRKAAAAAGRTSSAADSAQKKKGRVITMPKALRDRLKESTDRLKKLPPGEASKRIKNFMIQRAPMVMFLLLPIFALLLNLFFWRRRRHFTEHFVYALHTHALMFFIYTVMLVLPKPAVFKYVWYALMLAMFVYQWLAMKRVYGQGWFRTTLKLTMIGMIYFTVFVLAIAAEAMTAVLMV